MQDISFATLMVVFEEIFGRDLFRAMIAVSALVLIGYLYVLIRDREVNGRKFIWAQLSMPFGAVGAVWFVLAETHSALSDIGGPVDVILMLTIAAVGAVGLAILVYTLESLFVRRPPPRHIF